VGFEPTVTLPPQWLSRGSAVRGPPSLLPASLALAAGSLSKIIPRISRAGCCSPCCAAARSSTQRARALKADDNGPHVTG
jgi:hypothetical protein